MEYLESLGQLVVSLMKEMLETNRKVLELEKRISELERAALERKPPEPAKA